MPTFSARQTAVNKEIDALQKSRVGGILMPGITSASVKEILLVRGIELGS